MRILVVVMALLGCGLFACGEAKTENGDDSYNNATEALDKGTKEVAENTDDPKKEAPKSKALPRVIYYTISDA